MKGFEGMEEMKIDHRHSRTRGANACAGRAVAPLPPRGRGTRPACPQWLVAICAFFAFTLTAPAADPTISISARQRYPWNGLVDLNFTITGTSGTKYDTSFTAKDIVGNTNITMATIRKADGSAANVTKESLLPGNYKWVWDAAADLPDGFECDQVTVTGVAVELTHLYMVIDLSSGPDSTSYPVSYLDAVPDGGWSDEYKTTKLVLRRIEPGTFKMCGQYNVTLTRPFYIGVFEVTQKQYENITGERPSVFQTSYEVRPVDHLFYYNIRLSFSSDVPLNSFIGKIRERTGISNIDFPTEAQWEYACRAGTTTDYNNGKDNTSGEQDPAMEEIGRYWHNGGSQASNYTKYSSYPLTSGTAAVGSYAPNEWGLYDMHGNVCEWCLDKLDNVQEGMIDPEGSLGFQSIMRGGGWRSRAEECTSIFRRTAEAQYVIYHNAAPIDGGFRVCLTLSAEVKAEEYEVRDKVQLWEGGPYWADMNIGAKAPWEYGYYFWWGDTMGYKRENDVWVASDGSVTNFFFEAGGTCRLTVRVWPLCRARDGSRRMVPLPQNMMQLMCSGVRDGGCQRTWNWETSKASAIGSGHQRMVLTGMLFAARVITLQQVFFSPVQVPESRIFSTMSVHTGTIGHPFHTLAAVELPTNWISIQTTSSRPTTDETADCLFAPSKSSVNSSVMHSN